MNWSPLQAFLTLFGGLALAAIIGWVKRSRLVVFVPKLFSHSMLSSKGHLAEVSIFNRGIRTEEAVEVSLNPALQYEIVGSTNQDAALSGAKLSLPRIGAGDDVTVLLLVEGSSTFGIGDISNCLSKETKGTMVTGLEKVPPTWQQRISLVVMFGVIPSFLYLSSLALDYVLENHSALVKTALNAVESDEAETLNGWQIPSSYGRLKRPIFKAFDSGAISVVVGTPTRKGDLLTIPFTVTNKSNIVLTAGMTMNSQQSVNKIPSYDLSARNLLVTPGASVTRSIVVVVPVKTENPLDRNVYLDGFLQGVSGDSLQLTRVLVTS